VADMLEMTQAGSAEGLAHAIAAAGLQVSQAADELRAAAERLVRAERQALEAQTRAATAEEQLQQSATKNAELLEMLESARSQKGEADERRRRAEERIAHLEEELGGAGARAAGIETELAEAASRAEEAERRTQVAEERLELIAAQNAELLELLERAQEGRADGEEETRRLREQLEAAEGRAGELERRLHELETRMREVDAPPHLTVIVNDEERATLKESVAAEVRRPLTSILGLTLALKHTEADSPDAKDMVRQLATHARKLDRLVGQMLDLERIADGTFEPRRRRTDLEALVRRVIEESQDLVKRDVHVDAEHVAISVDPQLTEQIVDALIANAGKRTAQGNPVWVRIAPEDGGALIAVEDTGSEVPAGLRSAMFAALGEREAGKHPKGATGLSLLAKLAQVQGGEAWVEERSGGGASFRVFLPDGAPEAGGEAPRRGRAIELVPDEGAPAAQAPNGNGSKVEVGGLPDVEALRELLTS